MPLSFLILLAGQFARSLAVWFPTKPLISDLPITFDSAGGTCVTCGTAWQFTGSASHSFALTCLDYKFDPWFSGAAFFAN